VFFFLRTFVRIKLWRIKPQIIGITGSYAKTSTRDALAMILGSKYVVRKNRGALNTEYGVSLDLLEISYTGKVDGRHSVVAWFKILIKGFWNAFFSKEHYQKLILELGVDKPGDMDLILKVIKPDLQIVTGITLNHVEFGFATEKDIWDEKKKLVYALDKKGTAVLNIDDKYIAEEVKNLQCQILTFGERNIVADLKSNIIASTVEGLEIQFIFKNETRVGKFAILGSFHALVLNAAIAGALALGIGLDEAIQALNNFQLPEHRMTKIQGINHSVILDSTYNASPKTIAAALDLLKTLKSSRKIAVLGSMNELGEYCEKKHIEIGNLAADCADILVAIGHSADLLTQGWQSKCSQQYFAFENSDLAAEFLRNFVKEGDLILMKGSHSVNVDKVVEGLKEEGNRE